MSNKEDTMNFVKKVVKKTKEEIKKAASEIVTVLKKEDKE